MSQAENEKPSPAPKARAKKVPDGIANGVLGFALGAGVTFLAMHFYGPRVLVFSPPPPADMGLTPDGVGLTPDGGGPGGGMGGALVNAAGGGNPGAAGKHGLTALVGKLELLSREKLNLKLKLDSDQAATIAAELAQIQAAKTLTAEEAQSHLEALESLFTPEQKETVDSIHLPADRPAGGTGTGEDGGMVGPADDENPFAQEANEKRLKELLERIKPAGS